MKSIVCMFAAAAALSFVPAAQAQTGKANQAFVPQVGQSGKDVIWVPTPDAVVKRMLEMAKVDRDDFVIDLGSGDGRTVIAAARDFKARALGVEFNPRMVELSRKAASRAGVSKQAEFRRADIFTTDFSKATVVTMYLLPDLNLRLRPRLLGMKPGTRVVSHSFSMGDWEPDQSDDVQGHGVYLWIVPARIAGRWTLSQTGASTDITWTQRFQRIQGSARSTNGALEVLDAKLSGDRIAFALVADDGSRLEYTGKVTGNAMQGMLEKSGAAEMNWTAEKTGDLPEASDRLPRK